MPIISSSCSNGTPTASNLSVSPAGRALPYRASALLSPLTTDNFSAPFVKDQARPLPRLLFVATSKNDGGVERYAVRMAAGLHERGADIRFACAPNEIIARLCAMHGIPIVPLTVGNSGDIRAAFHLAQGIVSERIDLVHAHSRRDYLPVLVGVALARLRGQKARVLLHAHMVRPLGTPVRLSGRFFARAADGIVAVSEAVKSHLLDAHQFPLGFVRVVYNGIDIERFALPQTPQAQEWRARLRGEWQIPPEAPVVVTIGRLDAKGQAFLLSVAPRLIAQVPDLHFVLVGAEGKPGSEARLRAMADASGISGSLRFTGPREDIPAVLAATDALAHLPTDEAFGLALAEAMAAGLPTIATDIGGCREVVRDKLTGFLVPPGDEDALAQALLLLFGENGAHRRAHMGAAGRERVSQEFSLSQQLDHLEQLYRALCSVQFQTSR